MDFYRICVREIEKGPNKGSIEVYPDFVVGRTKDLMVRGKSFYAVWDEERGLWSTDEYDVQHLVDQDVMSYAKRREQETHLPHIPRLMASMNSGIWVQFRKYMANISDNSRELDSQLTFMNTPVKKSDYVSKRLPYNLEPGDYSAWDELVGTLYNVEERAKVEWIIGAIVAGDSVRIQKFGVFYGPAGTGKSTILNICMDLFVGYTTTFEAKALGSNNGSFATEAFKGNPLVAIQQDGDLSRIEDNTRLNSIIAHEPMTMNEKYKPSYTSAVRAFLLMGTNQPVKITDAKSGIIRRLIDIHPTGVKIPVNHYNTLMQKIEFQLGAIAYHCLQIYREMGKNFYNGYRPLEMMLQTDVFFNFIEAYFDVFKSQDSTTLRQAYVLYKEYCADTGIERVLPQYKVREELRNYFDEFKDKAMVDGVTHRSYYVGFNANKFKEPAKEANAFSLVIDQVESLFDEEFALQLAQYEIYDEKTDQYRPAKKWENCKTELSEIDTAEIHYVKVPEHHIVIDFDLKDLNGDKSLERNLEAASAWPATYAELSKSGGGVHLHYNYEGDVHELANVYSEGIEVKTLLGDSSLRRKLTLCNNVPIATLNVKLPVKEKKVLSDNQIKSETGLRDLIARNLRKEIHPGTKPSIDFIKKILDDAHESGMSYDVSDMKRHIMAFANNSTNQALLCLKVVATMKFKSDVIVPDAFIKTADDRPAIYDVEVYPNLFVVCWKFVGAPDDSIVAMINPSPAQIEDLLKLKLVGFYNRRYDNHILYAALQGYNNQALFELSQKIISNDNHALFGSAYSLSYADIYDFASIKMTLKKWEIELGVKHMEMDIPWDKPVPEELIPKVVEYCCNDVYGTEAVWNARQADFKARQILAELSGLTVNDTTQRHTARIIFGDDRNPQAKFVYTHLNQEFPGYKFEAGKSTYRGEEVGEGGYVYAEPGMYEDVPVADIASMHPTTIIQLNLFGEYTKNFAALVEARLAIKRGDYASARTMLNGKLKPFLESEEDAKELAYALKIVINIVYGLTAAKFENPFRDKRNRDNIVAKRGALFMVDLKQQLQEQGIQVAHIKTDSIKIPGATPEVLEDVINYGAKYGYTFELESVYKKFCLVNDAVYIAKKEDGSWEAVGAQFQHPFVYKTLFSGEEVTFADLCEPKSVVQGAMYLDFELDRPTPDVEAMHFVGRTGLFVPVPEGTEGAGILYRVKDGKLFAVTGTKGHLWMEAHVAADTNPEIDMSYFEKLQQDAIKTINKFGDFDEFVK